MTDDHARKAERVYTELYVGNGKKPLVKEVMDLRKETNTIWQDLYKNEHTGESGLVADVKYIKNTMWWVRGAAAAVSAGVVLGVALAVQSVLGG